MRLEKGSVLFVQFETGVITLFTIDRVSDKRAWAGTYQFVREAADDGAVTAIGLRAIAAQYRIATPEHIETVRQFREDRGARQKIRDNLHKLTHEQLLKIIQAMEANNV